MKSNKSKIILGSLFLSLSIIGISGFVVGAHVPPGGGGNPSIKWGFFFWASDVGCSSKINGYENLLQAKGYVTHDYKDADLATVFTYIDSCEDYNDKLFLYFYGHGYYEDGQSHVWHTPYYTMSSSVLRNYISNLETSDICILIDSCHAGEFVSRFSNDNGYLVMTSTDRSTNAGYNKVTKEGLFSWYFWLDIACWGSHSAKTAFLNARSFYWYYNSKYVDNSVYTFF
ncbi:MAG: hypothetical protein ACFE8B_14970 [Candidatus Hermodarchaeota archaeon]